MLALPFAAFFLLVSGQARSAFPGYWIAATVFALGTGLGIWAARHTLQDRLQARFADDPRASLIQGGMYLVASLVGAAASALVLNATIIPGMLGSARAVVMLVVYTLLFAVLFLGLSMAMTFYRKSLVRAGADRELQLARRIQRSFLLSDFPRSPRLDVYALNVSSKEVSGDFYDVVVTPGDGLLLAVADVSGKGVPAALLSSMLQASLRTQAGAVASPAAMMRTINALACQRDNTGQFATFFLAAIDEPTMTLRYTNAGHNFPVLQRADGTRELLDCGGLIVGMLDGTLYDEGALQLRPGDLLLFYTDGVTEAALADGSMYGEERLYARLAALGPGPGAEAAVHAVLDDVRAFLGGTEAGDDITVMALRVLPPGPAGQAG